MACTHFLNSLGVFGLIVLAFYTFMEKRSGRYNSQRSSNTRAVRWGGGANIRGVGDLPKDPKSA